MKKFEFSLERILNYRQSIYDKEKNVLMGLYATRNDIEQELDGYKKTYGALCEEQKISVQNGIEVFEYKQLCLRLESAKRKIEEVTENLKNIEYKIDRQKDVVTQASKEVKVFENLKEKKQEEFDFELSKEEQERIMELVGNKAAEQVINSNKN